MTTETQTRAIVRVYHEARTTGDLAAAGTRLAPTFSFQSPMMTMDNPSHYLASLELFQKFVTGLDLISELYGDGEATLIYDVHTVTPVGTQRTAEHFTVQGDLISSIFVIFDASGWRPFFATVGGGE